ncbi:autotransporter domain-containing protein [Haloferula sp. A504]|uniref:autotransporter domain-containing protein n=1 Tax=Haloferula sp. A504 TaxID=3373601 RepID=UPI0031BEB1BE|nr:autotransporter outer membrane beta-barrel domain-containing protein [Verrucomicrobiaceae bacterium E54]
MKTPLLTLPLLAFSAHAFAGPEPPNTEGPPPVISLPFVPTNISGDGTAVVGPDFFELINNEPPPPDSLTASYWTFESGTVELFPRGAVFGVDARPLGISRDGRFVVGGYQTLNGGGMMDLMMRPGYLTAPNGFWIDRQTGNAAYLSGRAFVDVSDSGDSVVGYNFEPVVDTAPQFVTDDPISVNVLGPGVATWWQGAASGGLLGTGTPLGALPGVSYGADLTVTAMDGAGTRAVGSQRNFLNGGANLNALQAGPVSRSVYWDLGGPGSPQANAIPLLASEASFIESFATDISRNGAYIVGSQYDDDGWVGLNRPYLFTVADGALTEIPVVGGYASGVSNTGRVVGSGFRGKRQVFVGTALTAADEPVDPPFQALGAWVFDEEAGPRTINEWLADSGAEVGDVFFQTADAISEDGTVIVGRFGSPDNYPVEVDEVDPPGDFEPVFEGPGYIARAGSGAINPAQFIPTLQAGAQPGPLSYNLLNMTLHGAHHVPLQMRGADRHAWITGDFARNDRYDSDSTLAEVGGAIDLFDQQLVAGLGVGQSWVSQDLLLGGETELDGQYVLGELSFRATDTPFIFTLTGAYGSWDADVDRNYFNGGLINTSFGKTDVTSSALRLRADWLDAAQLLGFGISPKLEYTVTRTESDAYTEVGGGFPATFNSQSQTIHQLRYGLTAARPVLQEKGLVRVRAEGVHRFDDSDARTTGTVLGLGPFNLAGRSVKQDWFLFGVDFDYAVTDAITLTSGLSTATSGQDPVFGATLGALFSF